MKNGGPLEQKLALRIAWWNTGLSPPRGGGCPTEAQWRVASEVVATLVDSQQVDILGLGEVTSDDVSKLRSSLHMPRDFDLQVEDKPVARIGVLHDRRRVRVLDDRESGIDTIVCGKTVNRMLRFAVDLVETETRAYLFFVHWPSRMVPTHELVRGKLGEELCRTVRDARGDNSFPVVVLGDFNDEPFDQSLAFLQCSRDRSLVRRKPDLLYNPFWRWLGEQQPLAEEGATRRCAGTHHWKSGLLTHWFTFDQALVSASLLGGGPWTLCEERTGVLQWPPLLAKGRICSGFDHFPIVVTLIQTPAVFEEKLG
jgi:hypothetical protein